MKMANASHAKMVAAGKKSWITRRKNERAGKKPKSKKNKKTR